MFWFLNVVTKLLRCLILIERKCLNLFPPPPPLGKNTENMHSSKMVKTAKPKSRSLYTDETRRGKKERKSLPRLGFFFFFVATAINTVFTDEVMPFALRGQRESYPRLVRGGWSTEIKDQSWGQTVHKAYTEKPLLVNRSSILVACVTEGATVKHEDRTIGHDRVCGVKCKRRHHSGLALRLVSALKLSACAVVGK